MQDEEIEFSNSIAFSPDGHFDALSAGRLLAMAGMTNVIFWDAATGEKLFTLAGESVGATLGYNLGVGQISFSPDGERLAVANMDGAAKVWDLASGAVVTTFNGHPAPVLISNIVFSADGRSVFTGADDTFVRQWDAATGAEIRAFFGDGKDIYGVALSPDGQTLAMGDQDGMMTLWDVASGTKLRTFGSHAGLLMRLVFNADGTCLASAGFDRQAKVWDVASGAELFSLYGNLSNVFGVSFSPDGDHLVTAGADGTVRFYTLNVDELVALAQSRLMRGLTDQECRKFLHEESCP